MNGAGAADASLSADHTNEATRRASTGRRAVPTVKAARVCGRATATEYAGEMKLGVLLMVGVFALAGIAGYLSRIRQKTRDAWREGRHGR